MADIGYFDAWAKWWQGADLDGYHLAHVSIPWWGRIGKIVQLVGGFAVVADLIGEDRLREWAQELDESRPRLVALARKLIRTVPQAAATGAFYVSLVLVLVAVRSILDWPFVFWGFVKYLAIAAGVILVGVPALAMIGTALASGVLFVVGLLGQGVARALHNASWSAKAAGLVLLVVGVHFDLLAG